MKVHGVLLLYWHPPTSDAPTIREHVEAFGRYSRYEVCSINTALGFPRALWKIRFSVIILHYSPFGSYPFALPRAFKKYIKCSYESLKIAFFQDEYQNCDKRFRLIDTLEIHTIYSLLEPKYFQEVYYKNTKIHKVKNTLAGYVCDSLVESARTMCIHFNARTVDVGYRARSLSFALGKGGQEKVSIAQGFMARCQSIALTLDIQTGEASRIYGQQWHRFVANCKFMLGVEAGVSIFDITGNIRSEVDQYIAKNPSASFEDVERDVLRQYEENIPYRMISPRIFEAAAFRSCLILYEGEYQSILTPGVHYIPLKKDFSNFEYVLRTMSDHSTVKAITDRAYNDLIASNLYHYARFISELDAEMKERFDRDLGGGADLLIVNQLLDKDKFSRDLVRRCKQLRHTPFPGRNFIRRVIRRTGLLPII